MSDLKSRFLDVLLERVPAARSEYDTATVALVDEVVRLREVNAALVATLRELDVNLNNHDGAYADYLRRTIRAALKLAGAK